MKYGRDATDYVRDILDRYFGIDLEVIWRTIQEDLPALQASIEHMLAALE